MSEVLLVPGVGSRPVDLLEVDLCNLFTGLESRAIAICQQLPVSPMVVMELVGYSGTDTLGKHFCKRLPFGPQPEKWNSRFATGIFKSLELGERVGSKPTIDYTLSLFGTYCCYKAPMPEMLYTIRAPNKQAKTIKHRLRCRSQRWLGIPLLQASQLPMPHFVPH